MQAARCLVFEEKLQPDILVLISTCIVACEIDSVCICLATEFVSGFGTWNGYALEAGSFRGWYESGETRDQSSITRRCCDSFPTAYVHSWKWRASVNVSHYSTCMGTKSCTLNNSITWTVFLSLKSFNSVTFTVVVCDNWSMAFLGSRHPTVLCVHKCGVGWDWPLPANGHTSLQTRIDLF